MKAWITTYALSAGVLEVETKEPTRDYSNMIQVVPAENPHLGWSFTVYFHGEGKDWHKTLDSARQKFEKMKHNKIVSLRKQLAKLEKQEFKCKTNPT